jgi:hypothetical protein
MISWRTPGTGWIEWASQTAAIVDTSTTYAHSNGVTTSSTQNPSTGGSSTFGGAVPRNITTSTTQSEEVVFVSTSLGETVTTQHTAYSYGSTIEQITTSLPVSYAETTTRTNTVTTALTQTENNNGPDFTVYQAVGNEVLWIHPLTPVTAYFEPYAASDGAVTATRATIYPRTETISVEPVSSPQQLTNPQVTNASLSFAATTLQTSTVTTASGSSIPMDTFTTTSRVQTTTGGGSYQFSVASNIVTPGGFVAGTTTTMVTATMLTSISKSYQFGTYAAGYESTTSYTQYSIGAWGTANSFTYFTNTGSVTVATGFSGVSGVAYKPIALQGGFALNAGMPAISDIVSLYGGSRAVFAGTQSGAFLSAQSTVFFETAALNSQPIGETRAPQSAAILPTSVTGIKGSANETTQYSVSWSGPSFSATSKNSSTKSTYSGIASAVSPAAPASVTQFGYAYFPMMRIGGHLPDGITGVADAARNLVKIGIGTNTTTSTIGGQTTWSGSAAFTYIEPISSVNVNTYPSFEKNADAAVWAVSKYKQDPYPPYSLPEI